MNKLLVTTFLLSLSFLQTSMCTSIHRSKSPKKVANKFSKNGNKNASSTHNKNQSEKSFPNQQFFKTQLKGYDYHKSYLGGMRCESTKMEEMYMWRADLSKAKFKNTTLLEVNLIGADCSNIKFIGKIKNTNKRLECDNTCFQNGTFNNTTFEECDFFDTNFTKAMFNNAEFIKSCFSDSSFSNANLNSVIFESNECENMNFANANLNSVIFVSNECENVNFANANLNSVMFVSHQCKNTNFANAILNSVTFNAQEFENANFDKAVLTNVTFKNICRINFNKTEKIEREKTKKSKFTFTKMILKPSDLEDNTNSKHSDNQIGPQLNLDNSNEVKQQEKNIKDEKGLFFNITINNKVTLIKDNKVYRNRKNSQIECTFSKPFKPLISITLLVGGLTKLVMEV